MENETALIEEAGRGDREAFGKLYDFYIRRIYDFIFYRVKSKETAEDLSSDVFFKALAKLSGFNPAQEKSSFSAWLYRIARNRVIDYYRANHIAGNIDDWSEELKDESSAAEDLEKKERQKNIFKYLAGLKEEQREIILMRVWDELSYKEIALLTGKSEAALKMSFSRAIKILRARMPADLFALFLLISLIK